MEEDRLEMFKGLSEVAVDESIDSSEGDEWQASLELDEDSATERYVAAA